LISIHLILTADAPLRTVAAEVNLKVPKLRRIFEMAII
jgi:hypothetical protein